MRYVTALAMGRENIGNFKIEAVVGPKQFDLLSFMENQILNGTDLKSAIAKVEPPIALYGEMEQQLVKYMSLAKQDDGEKLPVPTGIVFFGTAYEGVPRLARLLRLVGDLPPDAVIDPNSKIYDGALVDAVKKFQKRHAIRVDGYLNAETIAALNVPLSDRLQQIRLSLERSRWVRYDLAQPPIFVNVPGFRLVAFDEQGKAALTMTIDAGQEYTPTPMLEDKIEYLVFRPYWDVPADIQRDEIAPNIKEDPDYLLQNNFEAVAADGRIVTDGAVSPAVLQQIATLKLHIREKPGPDNSLGLVKFIFPNEFSVYLHDTPAWGHYFEEYSQRDKSHGCIHLSEPAKLAAWALRDKPEWTAERIQQEMKSGKDDLRVNLTNPIPVLIIYMTAALREDGDMYFFRDVYGYDAELTEALAKGYPYPR